MKNILIGLFLICLTVSFPGRASSDDEKEKNRRLEANFSYEYLSPRDSYDPWKTFSLAYYHKPVDAFTYFLQIGGFSREEGEAFLGNIGCYKDWAPRLYTFSSLTAGTNSEYLPRIRVDHDFNIKAGPNKDIVWTLGAAYIKYFDVHKDLILSTGITWYLKEWILNYRIFRNDSSPGDVISYSHLMSAGYGREGWQWTYLTFSYGKQAYLATYLASPEEVTRDAFSADLKHRRWIGKGYGIFVSVNYFKLNDGYEKYGISPGIFKEF
jgi:YaiO family outer membrane protein